MILFTTEDLKEYSSEMSSRTDERILIEKSIKSIPKDIKSQIQIILSYGVYDDRLVEDELMSLPNLKWIHILSSGTEQLPHEYLSKNGIVVTTSKGIHSIPISEYVMGMILYFSKEINKFNKRKEMKKWDTSIKLTEIYGRTIGILGTGHIGQAVAVRAKAFGMQTIGVNRSGGSIDSFDRIHKISDIKQVIGEFDYICSVLPSNATSKGLVNQELINLMKDGVVFINVGRGDLIVENVFLDALQTGKISWAALDVFKEEPLDPKHPFWDVENLVITPHSSAVTNKYIKRCLEIFYHNYHHFMSHEISEMNNLLKLDSYVRE